MKTSSGLKIIMLDGKSASQWKRFFESCDQQKADPENQQREVSKIVASEEFNILKIQTKIFSGIIALKHDEIILLEK